MQIEFQGATTGRRFAVIDWQEYLDLRDVNREVESFKVWKAWAEKEMTRRDSLPYVEKADP